MGQDAGLLKGRTCSRCGYRNRLSARFCADCGLSLIQVPKKTCSSGGCSKLLFVILAVGAAFMWFGPRAFRAQSKTQAQLDLPADKAAALFDLLKPGDITVLVERGGRSIEGTPAEVETLKRFVDILTRMEGLTPWEARNRKDAMQQQWTSTRSYRLQRSKAQALCRILEMDDVPVAAECHRTRLEVRATPSDQAIISGVADILRGNQPPRPSRRW